MTKAATFHAMEMLTGTLFDRDDPNIPLGVNFDVSTRPLHQLLAVCHRFERLVCTLAPDLSSETAAYDFKNHGQDAEKEIKEHLKLGNLKRASRVLDRYNVDPQQAFEQVEPMQEMNEAATRKLFRDLHPATTEPDFPLDQAIHDLSLIHI